ncbi:MAG: dockerin type I repeat-containing protein [Christensenellales bacterium]
MKAKCRRFLILILLLALLGGQTSAMALTIELPPIHFPLTITFTPPLPEKSAAVVGEKIEASWTISGGSPPYDKVTSQWLITGHAEPSFVKYHAAAADYVSSIVPLSPITCRFQVIVEDGGLILSKESQLITVSQPEPLAAAFTFSKESLGLSQTIQGSWQVSGGVPPYQQVKAYWTVNDGGVYHPQPAESVGAQGSSSFTPSFGDQLALCVDVVDAAGHSALFLEKWIPILHPLPILIELPPLSKSAVTQGDIVMGSWSASGGNLPYQSVIYQWRAFSGGTALPGGFEYGAAEGYDSHWPQAGDQLLLFVEVTDSGGYVQSKTSALIPILPVRLGDANQDGVVDLEDLVMVIDFLVSNTVPASFTNADAKVNGTIDIADLVWIIDKIVGG